MELSASLAPIHTSTKPHWTPDDDLLKAEPAVGEDENGTGGSGIYTYQLLAINLTA